jgi:DNA-binding PadR family transcriptional regulator
MYELFILGKLIHRPMHGYLLQSIIDKALGPYQRLSWGTLYPLLRKLEKSGLIAAQRGGSSDRRGTKNYRITPRGRTRFFELMRSPGNPGGQYRELFRVKLSNFGHIGKEDQRSILTEYRALVAGIVKHSEAMSSEVRNAPGLASAERPYVLDAIDHQRYLAASEIAWVDALMKTTRGNHGKRVANEGSTGSKSGSYRRGRASARSGSDPQE